MAAIVTCSVDGCERPVKTRGMCGMHYQRFRKHDFSPFPRPTASDRFWAKVEKRVEKASVRPDLGPCWVWTASTDADGYGRFREGSTGSRTVRAHRWLYQQTVGSIPWKHELDHLCRVRACVNPEHLEVVTTQENIRRARLYPRSARRPAALRPLATHCGRGHEFTPENTIRTDPLNPRARACRICVTINRRARRDRLRPTDSG